MSCFPKHLSQADSPFQYPGLDLPMETEKCYPPYQITLFNYPFLKKDIIPTSMQHYRGISAKKARKHPEPRETQHGFHSPHWSCHQGALTASVTSLPVQPVCLNHTSSDSFPMRGVMLCVPKVSFKPYAHNCSSTLIVPHP